jgi:hypothetical protein
MTPFFDAATARYDKTTLRHPTTDDPATHPALDSPDAAAKDVRAQVRRSKHGSLSSCFVVLGHTSQSSATAERNTSLHSIRDPSGQASLGYDNNKDLQYKYEGWRETGCEYMRYQLNRLFVRVYSEICQCQESASSQVSSVPSFLPTARPVAIDPAIVLPISSGTNTALFPYAPTRLI